MPFSKQFLKKDSLGFIMVCKIGGQLGTKVVISALGMLALYMRFNGTGIWGGETKREPVRVDQQSMTSQVTGDTKKGIQYVINQLSIHINRYFSQIIII